MAKPPIEGRPTNARPPANPRIVPAARAAQNVAVITIDGPIDRWSVYGVERRMKRASAEGANALVFEINTPGGELTAVLAICNLIKSSPITNTVAWINRDAYSGGAIIALACREMVVAPYASFGDALPIAAGPMGIQPLPDAEREKILGPLLSEVVDSARRNGYDELLVQGIVRQGAELWLIEHTRTGRRLFVNEEQYRLAVGAEPSRDSPAVPSATGVVGGRGAAAPPGSPPPAASAGNPGTGTAGGIGRAGGPGGGQGGGFVPAAPNLSEQLIDEITTALDTRSTASARPLLSDPDHAGQYRAIEYVSDGRGLIVLKTDRMLAYGLASEVIGSDGELHAAFGATAVTRLNETWSENAARLLSHPIVKGLLIVVFLLAVFIEMTHPGAILPGAVAAVCLVALVLPPLLVSMAAWWPVAAILAGIALIALELLVIPGFGVPGVLGVIGLFGGLIGLFLVTPQGLFPAARQSSDITYGVATVAISAFTAIGLMTLIARHLHALPIFNRLILSNNDDEADTTGLLGAMVESEQALAPGTLGVAITPLRPAGRVQIDDRMVDAVADGAFVDAGTQVRVVSADAFRVVVEASTGRTP